MISLMMALLEWYYNSLRATHRGGAGGIGGGGTP